MNKHKKMDKIKYLFRFIKIIFGFIGKKIETGNLIVSSGDRTIKIDVGFTPKNVWINSNNIHCIPVCQGNLDTFDVKIVPGGFILISLISSEYRKINWIAIK